MRASEQESHSGDTGGSSYLSVLNQEQRLAVETLDGALLVLAGAGTGKTRVLTTRLAHLLNSGRAYPSQILAVTFTNKAAQEMRERVSALIGGASLDGWWLGTFHALAARMLRRYADRVGLSSNFTILDPDDQVRLIKPLMEARGIDVKKWPPKLVMSYIERWKDRALLPDKIEAKDVPDVADGKLVEVYRAYQSRLKEVNACDFGDLLLHAIELLRNSANADILQEYHRRFRYILVDEYQDTNVAQYLWLRLLAQGTGNICCVGDDDQSIYGWRGAEVGNILRFERDFADAKIVRLEQNYRSTNTILQAAGRVISNNAGRLGKELWSQRGEGDRVAVCGLWDSEAEARWVGEQIEQLQRPRGGNAGESLAEIAVLVRTGFQTREFEERFIKLGISYRVIGGPRFYERMEIRDALAYLRVTAQEADDLALERIINTPKRGIGDATVQALYQHGRKHGICLSAAIRDLTQTDELKPKVRATLGKLMDDFERWRSLASNVSHPELAAQILDESGYMDMWKQDKSPEAPGRIENLREMIGGMQEYSSMQEFLEHVSLVLENRGASGDAAVTIMTLHGAKGLEFDTVFLAGWEEGLFPSQRTMDENGMKGLEEERRLAYVGITRARKRVFISHASNRRIYGNWVSAIPSRFVDELPRELIDIVSETGTYQMAGRSQHWDSSGLQPSPVRDAVLPARGVVSAQGTLFVRGDRVFHDKFGYGRVVNIDGHKLDILFDRDGQKRVMDSFLEKA